MPPMITIYALLEDSQIRYIGKTKQPDLNKKFNQHLREAIEKPEQFGWITNLIKQGQMPEIKSIFTFPEEEAKHYEALFLQEFKHFVQVKPAVQVII
jgi:hypothetical protein